MDAAPEQPPTFSAARRLGISFHVLLSCLALLAIVVMLNYLGARYYERANWSAEDRLVLAPLTRQVLAAVTNEVRATVFLDSEEPLHDSIVSLLNEYRLLCRKLDVVKLDYLRNPVGATQFQTRHRLPPNTRDFVLFECEGRTRSVAVSDLSDYDTSALLAGRSREVKRTAFRGEMMFTSALASVLSGAPARAYFLAGHQESDPADAKPDSNGFGQFAEMLRLNNVEAGPLLLAGANEVPADCQLLVIAGPRLDFEPHELGKLDKYLAQGGRLLVLLRDFPGTDEIGLEPLLHKWGVAVGNDWVRDPKNTVPDAGFMVTNFGLHAICRPFAEPLSPLLLVAPRSVGARQDMPLKAEAPTVTELLSTSEAGLAHTDFSDRGAMPNPARDRAGKLPLAVAVEKGALPGVESHRGATRIVVLGDVVFQENIAINNLANRAFGEKCVNWLLDRSHLMIGIPPKPVQEFKLTMTGPQMWSVRLVLLGAFPGTVLVFGLLVWWRRRH
jgi:hypothetical protein